MECPKLHPLWNIINQRPGLSVIILKKDSNAFLLLMLSMLAFASYASF